jgi:tripeptide aminopeptidase
MSSERLLDRFTRLCEIASPTGQERAVADDVLRELGELGVDVSEDDAAGPARAGSGNLIARVSGTGEGSVAFFAHLDTVPHDGQVEVVLSDGLFRSADETILGADNKAAVTVLMEMAARAKESPPAVSLELIFTVAEEEGLRGAKEIDLSSLRAPYGFALDHASPIGEVIIAAPTYNRVTAEFEGIEAHSGIRPEDGRSAIAAAAAAVSAMSLGRIDDETTANVGKISGGTASNVVAGACRLQAEARSLDDDKAAKATANLVDACTWAASEGGCDVEVDVEEMFRGYRLSSSHPAVALARSALEQSGFEAREASTGGGSDANALIARGYDCVLLANGTEANHTHHESVAAEALTGMLRVCEAIVSGTGAH